MSRGRTPRLIEPEITPASPQVTAEVLAEDKEYRHRDRCTVCGRRYEWYELEPGNARCVTCQT